MPVSGAKYAKYGGNTSSIEVLAGGRLLFFDAGTGITTFSASEYSGIRSYDIFLSHLHYDHVQGLPFFAPLFDSDSKVAICGKAPCCGAGAQSAKSVQSAPGGGGGLERALRRLISAPFLPLSLNSYSAEIAIMEVGDVEGDLTVQDLPETLSLSVFMLDHPGGSVAYKLTERLPNGEDRVFVYATDTSELSGERAADFGDFVYGADFLVHDAFFERDEMLGLTDGVDRTAWGHSSYEYAARLAAECSVKRLALFHHRECRTDEEIDAIEARAKQIFDGAFCSYDGFETVIQ